MKIIYRREQLTELAAELGVRPDWHEPDEQELTAEVRGSSFDNAGLWPEGRGAFPGCSVEQHVILLQEGVPVAAINLATLIAWAAETGS